MHFFTWNVFLYTFFFVSIELIIFIFLIYESSLYLKNHRSFSVTHIRNISQLCYILSCHFFPVHQAFFKWHLLKWLKKIFPYTKKNSPPKRPCFRVDWMEWMCSLWDEACRHRKVGAGCACSLPLTDSSVRRQLGPSAEAWLVFLALPVITGEEGRPHLCWTIQSGSLEPADMPQSHKGQKHHQRGFSLLTS